MRRTTTAFSFLFAFMMLFSLPAQAQQWYKVELIVFENLNPNASEKWPVMPPREPLRLSPGSANNFVQPASREDLNDSAQRLRNSAGYRVLTHSAWMQPALSRSRAQPIAISGERLEGQIRIHVATYLHADLDLWLLDSQSSSVSADGELHGARNPNLKELRRLRSRQVHYFDHPRLGALLRMEPVSTPDAALHGITGSESYSLSE